MMDTTHVEDRSATGKRALWRSWWAAIGAAIAVTFFGGLFVANAASSAPSSVVTIDPVRILDTRDPVNVGLPGPFVSPVSQQLQVAGPVATTTGTQTPVPVGATGVLLNVTVVAPTADGFVSIRPGDATGAPSTSSLNFTAGDIVPNSVQVGLPTTGANAGQIDITYDAFGQAGPTTDVLIDVVGYMVAGGGGGEPGSTDPALLARLDALEADNAALEARITALETKTASMSVQTVDGQATMRFTGVNVQVVDGTGDTGGPVNGLGNLIVGYHENERGFDRTGSHNLIVGTGHGYTSSAGAVFGERNRISGPTATVTGGVNNQATDVWSSVSGGASNTASGPYSSVSGGASNTANQLGTSVTGGESNIASLEGSSVTGGLRNTASGFFSSVTGGQDNTASGGRSSVTGGELNTASFSSSSVSGGSNNTASGRYSSVTGGDENTAEGTGASISGGDSNTATGDQSSIQGGFNNSATGTRSSISGGSTNTVAVTDGWDAG